MTPSKETFTPATPASTADEVYFCAERETLRLGNQHVELTLDARSGFFRRIRNQQTRIEHKHPESGVWPFGVSVGTRAEPEQLRAEIRADGVQEMTHRAEKTPTGGRRLHLVYAMLVDNDTRAPTGIGLGVTIELGPGQDYFIIRAEIANGGPHWLTRLDAGLGELLTGDATRTQEVVWVPARGGAGHEEFSRPMLGLPTYGWGWADYSGARGGIGVAYVNPQGIHWCFDWDKTSAGLSTSWRLFDLRGYWHFESLMDEKQKSLLIQPLEPASAFITGEWLLVPHEGDWHRTADVYRERFEEVFAGDLLTWDALPEKARDLDLYVGFWVAENMIGNPYPRRLFNHLDSVAPQVKAFLEGVGADPQNVGVGLTWFQSQVGRYPDFFPIWEEAGGESAWQAMIQALRALEVRFIGGYTHLAYHHVAARNYVPEADVQGTIPFVNPTAGERACVDNAAWAALWRDTLIPAYRDHGLDMVFMDEGHFPWGACAGRGPAHLHGPSAVGILTANTRGMLRLHALFHEGLGEESLIMTEGSGDVVGRWADLHFAYPWDCAIAYTLPGRRYGRVLTVIQPHEPGQEPAEPQPSLRAEINAILARGEFAVVGLRQDQPLEDHAEFRRFVEIRNQLRAANAPGYPQGFRHTVGVTVSDPALVAMAFAGDEGITVVYYADAEVDGEIQVHGARLGHAELGELARRVALATGELDFWIIQRSHS